MTFSQQVREQLAKAITCQCCGQQKITYVDLAAAIAPKRAAGIGDELLSRFLKGGQIKSNQLDLVVEWLGNQEELEETKPA